MARIYGSKKPAGPIRDYKTGRTLTAAEKKKYDAINRETLKKLKVEAKAMGAPVTSGAVKVYPMSQLKKDIDKKSKPKAQRREPARKAPTAVAVTKASKVIKATTPTASRKLAKMKADETKRTASKAKRG
jgi:hypothetical protein